MNKGKSLTLDDYNELIRRIREEDLPAAEKKHAVARQQFDEQFFSLSGRGEMATLNRLKKKVVEAREYRDDTGAALGRAEAEANRLLVGSFEAGKEDLGRRVGMAYDEVGARAIELDKVVADLAPALVAYVQSVDRLTTTSRESVTHRDLDGASIEEFHGSLSFVPLEFSASVQNIINQKLFGLTDGWWNTRSAGVETASTARDLPTLGERVRKVRDAVLSKFTNTKQAA